MLDSNCIEVQLFLEFVSLKGRIFLLCNRNVAKEQGFLEGFKKNEKCYLPKAQLWVFPFSLNYCT